MSASLDNVCVDLRYVLTSVSEALDAVGVDAIHHGYRVGYIAYRCARRLGWDEELSQHAFALGLIHDCGVSQSEELSRLFSQLIPDDTDEHCRQGYQLLKACSPLASFAPPILHHHTRWIQLKNLTTLTEQDKQFAALIFLADRVDFLFSHQPLDEYGNLTQDSKHAVLTELKIQSGNLFCPAIVDEMCYLVETDDFWFALDCCHIKTELLCLPETPLVSRSLGLAETIEVAEFMAKVVDAKSPFTFQHSQCVAVLTEFLGQQLGMSPRRQRELYLAGLLHDIGKLKTPKTILHKEEALTASEYNCIKRHATDSRISLKQVIANPQLVEWAANHHERLDGSGYPMGKTESELDLPSRIVALADVFQALTQSRPYRKGLSLDETMAIIRKDVADGKLDKQVFECIEANASICYALSTGRDISQQSASNE